MKTTSRQIMPIEIIRAYRRMTLKERRGLYAILRGELDYAGEDNSNLRKMLKGQRYVPAAAIKLIRDHLGLTRAGGNIQMDLMDIVGYMSK